MRKVTVTVPFSSLFYSSKPLEAALTRRPTQFFFIVLGSLFSLSLLTERAVIWDIHLPKTHSRNLPKTHFLEFTVLETRRGASIVRSIESSFDGSCLPDVDSLLSIDSLGLMLNGKVLDLRAAKTVRTCNSISMSLEEPVAWDSWFFLTSKEEGPENDPVRFKLRSFDGNKWTVVGSSSHWKIFSGVVFFHSRYPTSTVRGFREIFDVFGRTVYDLLMIWLGPSMYMLLGILGILEKEHLAIYIYGTHSVIRTLVCIALAADAHYVGACLYGSIALMHTVILALVSHDRCNSNRSFRFRFHCVPFPFLASRVPSCCNPRRRQVDPVLHAHGLWPDPARPLRPPA